MFQKYKYLVIIFRLQKLLYKTLLIKQICKKYINLSLKYNLYTVLLFFWFFQRFVSERDNLSLFFKRNILFLKQCANGGRPGIFLCNSFF